ncbi:hypothetical protein FSARC_10202 [Fusarium sarcochroum]|uniref:AAA+ ATPase domain-containing protein n=1 Tax=Fusarium sarcochroum TaxID=1208366 RepID=A0A8H4TNV7_9HYPO|nr:hypothetical protein FSARC_10202 [Fusarium sarcochroum]
MDADARGYALNDSVRVIENESLHGKLELPITEVSEHQALTEIEEEHELDQQEKTELAGEEVTDTVGRSSKRAIDNDNTQQNPTSGPLRRKRWNPDRAAEKRSLRLQHYHGEEFILPWDLCRTWKTMEPTIRLTYGNDDEKKSYIDDRKFQLLTSDGATIIPDHWDMLVESGWEVTIRLDSQSTFIEGSSSDDESDRDEEQDVATEYTTKVNFTITYNALDRYSRAKMLLGSRTYDDPVHFSRSRMHVKELPVLEEKVSVTVGGFYGDPNCNTVLQRGTKLNDDDVINKSTLHIHSPFLLNALRTVIAYTFNSPLGNTTDELVSGMFSHPYEDLFYHRNDLLEYKQQTTKPRENHDEEYNAKTDEHIDFLLKYLDQEPNVHITSLEAKWAKRIPVTSFAGFWLLMKPGSDVYVRDGGQLNAYVVDHVSGGIEYASDNQRSLHSSGYDIHLWNIKYDGKVISRMSKKVYLPVFDNDREIMSLPVIPAIFADRADNGMRRQQLIERGKKLFEYAKGPTFLEYTGRGLKPGWREYTHARVIVDHEFQPWSRKEFASLPDWNLGEEGPGRSIGPPSGMPPKGPPIGAAMSTAIGTRARAPGCECDKCTNLDAKGEKYVLTTFSDYDNIDPKRVLELSDHQYMLCMSHMYGFILKDRTYDLLAVDELTDVSFVTNTIDRLVMRPEANKATIKAIIETHTDGDRSQHFNADFIQGKGEGQIFLLHGPPGTGKTLTAESVAEYTRRPLLSITAADLGHEPIAVEKNLLQFFKDAISWDAIVLLDEADIYLERRSINDLRRNSIVSIFLRALDYFTGILFLTTNRVGHFDEAFMSRIHVSIGYDRLDSSARETIWENLFRKLKEDHKQGGPEIRYEYEAKQYVKKNEEILKLRWNGREIRNAFQTAVALATFDAKTAKSNGASEDDCIPEVKEKHLSQVVGMSAAFKHGGFEQTGTVDWAAIANGTVSFSVDVLSRLSKAGVEALTMCAARAIFSNVRLGELGESRLQTALDKAKAFPSVGDVLWFGFGIKNIMRSLQESVEGLTCLGICACLSEGYSTTVSGRILRELFLLYNPPSDLTPPLRQWIKLVETSEGLLAPTEFGLVLHGLTKLCLRDGLPNLRTHGSPKDIALVLKELFGISKGRLSCLSVAGGADCAWIAAVAHWLLNLTVEVQAQDGSIIYRPDGARRQSSLDVQVIIAYSQATPEPLQVVRKRFILPGGQEVLSGSVCLGEGFLSHGRVDWSTCLIDTFGSPMRSLLSTHAKTVGTCLGSAACILLAVLSNDKDLFGERFGRVNPPPVTSSGYGRGFYLLSRRLLPELGQNSVITLAMEDAVDKPYKDAIEQYSQSKYSLRKLYMIRKQESSGVKTRYSESLDFFPRSTILPVASILFTGREDRFLISGNSDDTPSAMSCSGLCFYLNTLTTITSDPEQACLVSIVPGRIEWNHYTYDYVKDSNTKRNTLTGNDSYKCTSAKSIDRYDDLVDSSSPNIKAELIVDEMAIANRALLACRHLPW